MVDRSPCLGDPEPLKAFLETIRGYWYPGGPLGGVATFFFWLLLLQVFDANIVTIRLTINDIEAEPHGLQGLRQARPGRIRGSGLLGCWERRSW